MPGSAGWHGHLTLAYRRDAERCVVHDRHEGPLRILASLYPEGPGVCHNVIVHPPGGIVGGDRLRTDATLAEGAHALITTPGAARFYRSAGDAAAQTLAARIEAGARLEWLPLETIVYSGALAESSLRFDLAAGAEMIGWDVLALGLPTAGAPFIHGRYAQSIALPGIWLERGTTCAGDRVLLDSPLGWAGQRVLATMWFAAGKTIDAGRREALLADAREVADGHVLAAQSGATSPRAEVVVLRALAPRVEPAMSLLCAVWSRWRQTAWAIAAIAPRVWRT